jgi:hypothetical protein
LRRHAGFSLHAGVRGRAGDKPALEPLGRRIAGSARAKHRVHCNGAGQVVLRLKTAWRDSTVYFVMSPPVSMNWPAATVLRPSRVAAELIAGRRIERQRRGDDSGPVDADSGASAGAHPIDCATMKRSITSDRHETAHRSTFKAAFKASSTGPAAQRAREMTMTLEPLAR